MQRCKHLLIVYMQATQKSTNTKIVIGVWLVQQVYIALGVKDISSNYITTLFVARPA
jgi:hypothetical protein